MHKVIALAALLATGTAYGQEPTTSLYLGGFSKHLITQGLNETHNFVGIQHDKLFAGVFNNSYNNTTGIVAYDTTYTYNDSFSYGLMSGMSYGYNCDDVQIPCLSGFMPLVLPYVEYTKSTIKPMVSLLGEALFITFKVDL